MAVTEHDLADAMRALRAEFEEKLGAQRQELAVQAVESADPTVALTLDDVRAELAALPEPEPGLSTADVEEIVEGILAALPAPESGLSRAEVEQLIKAQPVYGDEDLRGDTTRLQVYVNELADRIGAPRMEG